jgi:radical SAM protein with 4Fe4S-binding SPASM domain
MTKNIDKDVICLMPWIHMHIWPNGNVFPCCMSDSSKVFGNVYNQEINEAINSEEFKTLRKEMLSGVKPKACTRCYELETSADSWTLRRNSLTSFKHHMDLIENTNEDGSINDYKMRYMDIRFSNLCNFKCRTCGPELSSSWYDDQKKLFPEYNRPKFIDLKSNPDFMDDLRPHLDTIEEVYFAGGEALITPQHYEVLDYWLKTNRKNVKLRYTTNFSALKYKDNNILDYWKYFDDVRVAASLDTYGEKAEYSRSGTDWDKIVKNRKIMIDSCPNVYFEITPTVSVFSVYSLYEFHRSWVEENLLDINNIRVNILTHPRRFSITILPKEHKQRLTGLYSSYIDWLKENNANDSVINSVKGILSYMNSEDHTNLIDNFKEEISTIDSVRNERFIEIFPEFAEL